MVKKKKENFFSVCGGGRELFRYDTIPRGKPVCTETLKNSHEECDKKKKRRERESKRVIKEKLRECAKNGICGEK